MLFLDGVYSFDRARPKFHRAQRPTPAELVRLLHTISTRVARLLERQGLLVRDVESEYLDFEPLDWQALPDAQASRVATYYSDASIEDEDRWDEYLDWLTQRLVKLDEVLRPIVKALP